MKKLIKLSFLSIALSAGLTSCLKDDILLDPDKTENVVELVHTSLPQQKIDSDIPGYTNSWVEAASSDFPITVRYTGAHTAPEDIVVTIEVDPSLITTYNAQNDTHFETLPSNLYSFPTTVTIPKGGKEVVLPVTLKTNQFGFDKEYALPLKIASVSTGIISGNFGKAVFGVAARNIYDGVYDVVSGTVTRYTAPGVVENPTTLGGSLAGNPDVSLSTINGTTLAVSGHQWARSGGGIGGIDNLRLTIDPATNQVTMSALGNATLTNWAGKDNYYDPATRTFHLAFRWNPAGATREYEIVLKYLRPRD
jgi:hypothetical protein